MDASRLFVGNKPLRVNKINEPGRWIWFASLNSVFDRGMILAIGLH